MPPAPAKPDQMPIARARSSSGKVEVMIDRVTGMIIAAPMPAITRAINSISTVVESAAPTLARANTVRPASRMCLRPHRSPIAPIGRSSAARAIVYPLMTHRSWLCEAPRSRARSCWATLRPETDEMTATSDTIIAMRIQR